MSYSIELYKKVQTDLEDHRQQALDLAEMKKAQVYKEIPRLTEIDQEMSGLGLTLAKSIFVHPEKADSLTADFRETGARLTAERTAMLVENGYSESFLTPAFSCLLCEDTGKVEGRRCECFLSRLKTEALEEINKLSNLSLCSFDNFFLEAYPETVDAKFNISPREQMTRNFSYCQKYAETFSPQSKNILMIGQTGLGKTHLSLSIARTAIEKGYGVIYGSAPTLISQVEREKFGQNSSAPNNTTMELLQNCDLLVLDDLGTEFQTKFTISAIYDLLNTRLNQSLPTIISTNLSIKELEDAYTPRILSRITGLYDVLFFLGKDLRNSQYVERR